MNDCIFCTIIHENKVMKVYEDEWTVAFMDIAGDVDGHIVAAPKKHTKNILDCNPETLSKLMLAVQKISQHLVNTCGYDGVNVLNASDESAGQSIPHFHIHIIPRKNKDGIDAWPVFDGARQDIDQIWKKIKMA